MRKLSYICSLLIVVFMFSAGCAALVIGAGAGGAGVVWVKGKLEEVISLPVPRVHSAVRKGLSDLKISITEDKGDSLTAEVNGLLADGTKVWIDVDTVSASASKLTIRVGYLGDKTLSLRIRDAVKKHL